MKISYFERALKASKPGDVFVISDHSYPRFSKIAYDLWIEFEDHTQVNGNVIITHTLTRIK